MTNTVVPFVDLKVKSADVRRELTAAMERAVDDSQFILGDQVSAFERAFADFSGAEHCIGVANGTEALHLALRALGVGPGDEVITAANTFVATALAIAYTGASPVLVDVDPNDFTIDVELIERAITRRTKVILPVHLYGQPADLPAIVEIAQKHDLAVVQDACQAHGARIGERPVASFGTAACFSFYPSKNLGAFGDGGAVVTGCGTLAERIRMLRNYGQQKKNEHVMLGFNSRLDTLQAAILSVKLRYLEEANDARRAAAAKYRELLQDTDVIRPSERPDTTHVYHLYVVRHADRDGLQPHLQQAGVQCGIHYPAPIHHIQPFRSARTVPDGAPVSCRLAAEILSLPMYPELSDEAIETVSDAIHSYSLVAIES
ncbi:MAG: DegT/DnrJ/EryC1/StrS family aminotransferase [Pirellulales bacterium]